MQEQQFPQADSENLVEAERAAVRRVRTRRLQTMLAGAGALALSFLATACPEPADLQNPGVIPAPGGASSGGGGGGAVNCDDDPCVAKVFAGSALSCKLCHTTKTTAMMGLQSSGLDLESPNPSTRLKDVVAKHMDIVTPMGAPPPVCPTNMDKLIDTTNPAESWFYKKLKGQQGTCGTTMPQPPTVLKADEMACMEKYIACVAGKPLVPSAGGAGGGGGGGAGGASGGGGAGGASGGGAGGASGGGAGGKAGGGAGGGGGMGGA